MLVEEAQTEPNTPIGGYAILFGLYAAGMAGFAFWARAAGRDLRPRMNSIDIALSAIATHKASRLVAKDRVTAWIRRPFTVEEEPDIAAEISERARGRGLRKAVGELISCPYCIGQWIATAIVGGFVIAPRPTRFAVTVLTLVAISDFLQPAYRMLQERQSAA
jgi:hypothetical protein